MKIEGIRKNSKIWKNLFCRINVSYVRYIIYIDRKRHFFFALLCLPRCYY